MNEWVLQFFEIQRCVRSMWCAFIFWFEEKISVLCVRRVLLWCMFQYQYRYVEKVSSTYCTRVPAQVLCTFNAQLKKMMIRYDCWLLLFTKKFKNKSKILSYCTLQNA